MFFLAILLGLFSYSVLFLGLLNLLSQQNIIILLAIYLVILFFVYKDFVVKKIQTVRSNFSLKKALGDVKNHKLLTLGIVLLIFQALVNFAGVLGPELAFDALWYHLTLPKIFLLNHKIFHIPGGLLHYCNVPKLIEMLYLASLSIGNETLAKLVHFAFGILSSIALYKLSRKFLNPFLSLIVVLIFYANLVVAWESITAYIDLGRAFFEILAFWGFINWQEGNKKIWFILSALMLGLAISSKLIALGSLLIFPILIFLVFKDKKERFKKFFTHSALYSLIALTVSSPWFIVSFIFTGNPIYPIFTETFSYSFNAINILNPLAFVSSVLNLLLNASDPISPIYIMLIPLVFIYLSKISKKEKFVLAYCIASLIVWYVTPQTGGGRFFLPYLPAFSLMAGIILNKIKRGILYKYILFLIFLISFISIFYRGVANAKYVPVIIGKESKSTFLEKNLNFDFGDFYDTDNYFAENIKPNDKVLLINFHNLYYVNFPFIDSSWVKKADWFNYIAVQNATLPKQFSGWKLIYENKTTHVKLYTK